MWRCPLRWRGYVAGGSRVGVSTGAGTASVESGAFTSTVCVFSSEAAGCSSATIVRSPTCPVGTTAATSGLDPGAAGSGFDVGSDKHWLSASCDQPRHGLTFSRLAISRVMAFESVISRASTVFTGGISASGFAAAVATAGVCTGANANAPRGSELLSATMSPMPLVPAGDQSEAY